MNIFDLLLLALSLSMDAFAVSICKGLAVRDAGTKESFTAGAWFGGAQALMPIVGYSIGSVAASRAGQYSHWIAFFLLSFIGLNMIRESDTEESRNDMSLAEMLPLAAATSIDALAVGVMLSLLHADILLSACVIGAVTFALSAVGVKIGGALGAKYGEGARICGGITLIILGIKFLLSAI